ncbi:hypothetical protein, partial [Neptunitalea chrysea]|uniref:hypothetical protein n=1 Tax=Neptunitalea chrysea TaxID=1647581 RepID=UPI00248F6BDF
DGSSGDGSSGDGSSGDDSSSGGGSSDGSDNENEDSEIDTEPVLEEEIVYIDDCEDLKELSNRHRQNIDPIIDTLKGKLVSSPKTEWFASLKKKYDTSVAQGTDYNNQDYYNYSNTMEEGVGGTSNISVGGYYYAAAHTHKKKGYPIFSYVDVKKLVVLYNNCFVPNQPYVTLLVVSNNPSDSANPFIYAIKVDDISALENKVNGIYDSLEYSGFTDGKDREKAILRDDADAYKKNKNDLEKYFLEKYGDAGLDLYRADSNLNWSELTLNETNAVVSIPCAN